jgi:hypothetical protein
MGLTREPEVWRTARLDLDYTQFKQRSAAEEDIGRVIDAPTIVYDTDDEQVSIVYLELDDPHAEVVAALRRLEFQGPSKRRTRSGGLIVGEARTFGFMPRRALRQEFCHASALAHEDPEAHRLIAAYADRVARYYQQYNPDLFAEHQKLVEKVLPEYTLEQTVFTSGIINKNNPLPYHFDAGNFKNVWSNMLVFKRDISGGYLAVPEYDVAFHLRDNTLLMFDGQNILHGVTPIRKMSAEAHRFSMVFYSLRQMWNCLPVDDEIARIRKVRTERERKKRVGAAVAAGLGHDHDHAESEQEAAGQAQPAGMGLEPRDG